MVAGFSWCLFTAVTVAVFLAVPAGVAGNGHNSAPSRFVVAVTRETRAAAGSARFADASLSQLAQEGSRRLWPASAPPAVGTTSGRRRCRVEAARHPRRKAAQCSKCAAELHTFGPLCRLTFVFAPPNCSSAARLAAARAASACCDVVGSPIPPTTVCFTHTDPPHKQKAGSSWIATRSTLAACRHEPLAESARRSPWLPPTAPVPLPRFACFVSGSIEAIRHASISRRGSLCSPMHRSCWHGWRQRHQARRIGSLFVQAPSSGRHAPCRGWGRWASPRGTSAAMALPTASAAPRRLAFGAVA